LQHEKSLIRCILRWSTRQLQLCMNTETRHDRTDATALLSFAVPAHFPSRPDIHYVLTLDTGHTFVNSPMTSPHPYRSFQHDQVVCTIPSSITSQHPHTSQYLPTHYKPLSSTSPQFQSILPK
jgi:hypothetical protein